MVISIGNCVNVQTEYILSVLGYDETGVEIVLNGASLCFDMADSNMQKQVIELVGIAMHAEAEQAKIIADGLKDIAVKSFQSYSSRTLNKRLQEIASDIALTK